MKKRSLFKTGLLIILLIVTGKLIAFGKDIVISAFFGVGTDTDAFFIAFNITSILFVAFTSTISVVFLPLYNENKVKYGLGTTNLFSSNLLNLYLSISFIIISLTIYFAPSIVTTINSSTNAQNIELTISLLRIMSFSLLFTIFINFLTSIELSNEQYLAPHFAPIFNNTLVVIAIVIFASTYGIYVPAVAGVMAWAIQVPIHKWIVQRYFKYKLYLNLKDENIKKMGFLFFPAFLGVFIDQTNIMVDTILASGLTEGSVSALNYANRLISFASGIFIMAIMSIMYPIFSKFIVNNEQDKLNRSLRNSIRLLLLVMLPITAIVFVYHHEIVSIVFQRGKFDQSATDITASVFFYYSIGIIFLGLRELFNKVFYAKKNTKTPLLISTIAVSTNIILSIVFVKFMGVQGLALASSISLIVYVALQIYILHKHIGNSFYQGLSPFIGLLSISVLISYLVMWYYKQQNFFHNIYIDCFSGIILGTVCLLSLLVLFKTEEVLHFGTLLKKSKFFSHKEL